MPGVVGVATDDCEPQFGVVSERLQIGADAGVDASAAGHIHRVGQREQAFRVLGEDDVAVVAVVRMRIVRHGRTVSFLLPQTMMGWSGVGGVVPLPAAVSTGVAAIATATMCAAERAGFIYWSAVAAAIIAVRIGMVTIIIADAAAIGMIGAVEGVSSFATVDVGAMVADGIVAMSIRAAVRVSRHGPVAFPARAFPSILILSDCGAVGGRILVVCVRIIPNLNM